MNVYRIQWTFLMLSLKSKWEKKLLTWDFTSQGTHLQKTNKTKLIINNVECNTGSIQLQQPSYIVLWYSIDNVTIKFCVGLP